MSDQRLHNLYIARLTAQERPCFVCSKFTSVVLTSADNSNADWFYTCRAHLGDSNFCSKLGGNNTKTQPTKATGIKKESISNRPPESDSVGELLSGIGSAWKSWRKGGKEDEEKEDKKEDKKEEEKKEEKKAEEPKKQDTPPPSTPSSPQQPVRFVIQRDYFYLRQREHMKKIQKKEATEKLKTLNFPEVPKNMPTLK